MTPWNHSHIRSGFIPNVPLDETHWVVKIDQPGEYCFTLRRWPFELKRALNDGVEALPSPSTTRAFRQTPGLAFETLDRATISIAGKNMESSFGKDAAEVTFTMTLPAGPSELSATFHGEGGLNVGAYYVRVERIEQSSR